MGALGALSSFGAIRFLKKFKVDDTLDVFACHGVGGIVGSILTGVFASKAVNPAGADGLLYGDTSLMVPQILSTLVGVAIAVIGTWVSLKVVGIFIPLRRMKK